MGTVPIDQFEAILNILPSWIRLFAREYQEELEEIALQEGRPPSLWLGNRFVEGERVVEPSDLEAVKQKLKAEYQVEFREDGRAGISGTLHRISALYDRYGILVGMTIRLARVVKGLADPIIPFLLDGKSLLIIGPPGVGKTTLLRDVIRQLAIIYGPKVVIVDTSNEIGGEGRVPHPVLGASKRVQVRIPDPMKGENHLSMLARAYYEAVANHGPQIVVGDEVSSKDDVAVVETIGRRGGVGGGDGPRQGSAGRAGQPRPPPPGGLPRHGAGAASGRPRLRHGNGGAGAGPLPPLPVLGGGPPGDPRGQATPLRAHPLPLWRGGGSGDGPPRWHGRALRPSPPAP